MHDIVLQTYIRDRRRHYSHNKLTLAYEHFVESYILWTFFCRDIFKVKFKSKK